MITFNGHNLKDHFDRILDVRRDILPSRTLKTLEAAGKDGSYLAGVRRESRIIEVDVMMIDESFEKLRHRIEQVADILDTDDVVPMEIDDEPDRIRYVTLSENTDLEEVVYTGRTTLRFFQPEPWKYGDEEKSKGITSPPIIFERQSTAYLPEGDEPIPPSQPRYMPGKFGESILIEEGTTNLLSTPEDPAEEEVEATQGEIHTLSHDMGSVEVAHKREEDLTAGELYHVSVKDGKLVLDRYGEDLEEEIPLWSGTHDRTLYDGEGVTLDIETEEDTEMIRSQRADGWAGGENHGVKVENGNIVISNFPTWGFQDDMKDYVGTGWEARLGADRITQTANTVRMDSYIGESDSSTALVKETPGISVRTVDFLYWLTSPPGEGYDPTAPNRMQLILVMNYKLPGDDRYIAYYPTLVEEADLSGNYPGYVWVRCVIARLPSAGDDGAIDIYINGEHNRTRAASPTTLSSPRIQFIMENQHQGRFYLADFKYSTSVLQPTQPSFPFPLTGYRVSPDYDLSELGIYRGSSITQAWERNDDLPAGAEDYQHQAGLEVGVEHPVTGWSGYQPISSGGSIPQLKLGANLAGMKLRTRSELRSFDYYRSPILSDVRLTVQGHKVEKYTSGTWTADPVSLNKVGRAARGSLFFEADRPLGTRTLAEVALEKDGVTGEWVEVENGEDIPFLNPDADLVGASLSVRFHFSGSTQVSPRLNSAWVDIESAFYEEGYRISMMEDLSGIGQAAGSQVERSMQEPDGTRLIYEAQLSGGDWVEITGDTFPQIQAGTDLKGATLRTRQRLLSNPEGTATPSVERFRWIIHQDMAVKSPTQLENAVTVIPATGHLILTPRGVQRWQLEGKPYPTSFHPDERKPETLKFPAEVAVNEAEGTISLWAYESGLKNLRHIFDTEGTANRFALWHDENGNYYLRMNGENVAAIPADLTGWRLFSVRWKGEEAAFFIDGEKKWEGTLPAPFSYSSEWFYIGSDRGAGAQWNERLDEFHASNIARTDEELSNPDQPTEPDGYTTYLLKFDGSLSDYSAVVINEGTAPTIPRFEISVEEELQHLKILHIQTGQFLLLQKRSPSGDPLLRPGDFVELGRENQPVLINGHDRKKFLSLDSDFFRLVEGENTFEVTEGARAVAFWRERWK